MPPGKHCGTPADRWTLTLPETTPLEGPCLIAEAPSVIVGIVTRNRATILPRAIQSALAQDYPDANIIVLDDGSEDETPALRADFSRVDWHRSEHSRGFMEGRNELMRMAAKYFLGLDDDAWFMKGDEVGIATRYLDENSRVAAVAFDILGPDRDQSVARTAPYPVATFMGCGHLVRLSAALQVGLYQPSPEPYGAEERDLCIRFIDRGLEVHLLPGVHVWHERANISRDLGSQHKMGVCNDLAFVVQRCPLILAPIVFPIKLLNHLRFAIRRRFYMLPCLSGIKLFWRHFPNLYSRRNPVRTGTFVKYLQLTHSK